jgi:4-hydroxy-4-methyl-2-oxoglutarate aldolase
LENTIELLNQLKKIRTPIVCDVIEKFNLRPRNEGYMDNSIKSITPSLGVMTGYACTGKVMAEIPKYEGEKTVGSKELWNYVRNSKSPSVFVVQDLDQPPFKGCAWGDVAAAIYTSLGCIGAVTNGTVRDIAEVEQIGFHLFAGGPLVGHSNLRYTEINTPIKVGGLIVYPGDLIHADRHGVLVIPGEVEIRDIIKAAKEFLCSEAAIISYVNKNHNFDINELYELLEDHHTKTASDFINE